MISNFPYFSLIMPMYNRATTIRRAVESCLSQTFHNFELLITDDASTDESLAIVSSYNDSRIKVFSHKKNSGPCPARNTAIAYARGSWCVMVDSDFALLPHALESLFIRTQIAPFDVGNVASSCKWDTGIITPFPRISGIITLDFHDYLKWAESVKISEKMECIRRNVFDITSYPRNRAWEYEFHMNLAYRWKLQITHDVLVNIYTDAPNRITMSFGFKAIQRLLDDAPDKLSSIESIIREYGRHMRSYAPKLHNYTISLAANLAFLSGQRLKGFKYVSRAIIRRFWSIDLWILVCIGSLFSSKITAWATILRRQLINR